MVNNTAIAPGKDRATRFKPDLKCCTYHPKIPNYLVGALLANEADGDEGRRRILRAIQNRSGVTPLGIAPSRVYSVLYQRKDSTAFGNASGLLCPYYIKDSGMCSVWRYRDSVCSTFYCKYATGRLGKDFWDSLKTYLSRIENALAKFAVLRLGVINGIDLINKNQLRSLEKIDLSADDIDDNALTEEDYEKLWQPWACKELDFFVKAYELVKSLNGEGLRHEVGIDFDVALQQMESKFKNLTRFPPYLRATVEVTRLESNELVYKVPIRAAGASVDVSKTVLEAFDGVNSTEIVLRIAEDDYSREDALALFGILLHNGILTPSKQPVPGNVAPSMTN